jgi:hypothetical protein
MAVHLMAHTLDKAALEKLVRKWKKRAQIERRLERETLGPFQKERARGYWLAFDECAYAIQKVLKGERP